MSCGCLATEFTYPKVNYTLPKDGKNWKIGKEVKQTASYAVIYIPEQETMDNWTESFTIHHSPAVNSTNDFKNFFLASVQDFLGNKTVNHKIIKQNNDALLVEWWTNTPEGEDTHGWVRFIKRPQGTTTIEYATKKINEVAKMKKVWETVLNNAKIVK
jgi:hypothetical protein